MYLEESVRFFFVFKIINGIVDETNHYKFIILLAYYLVNNIIFSSNFTFAVGWKFIKLFYELFMSYTFKC